MSSAQSVIGSSEFEAFHICAVATVRFRIGILRLSGAVDDFIIFGFCQNASITATPTTIPIAPTVANRGLCDSRTQTVAQVAAGIVMLTMPDSQDRTTLEIKAGTAIIMTAASPQPKTISSF